MEEPYDIIIVGGGPAGLTAGLYASRHKAKTLVLEGARVGGKAYEAHLIENYPGFPEGISGPELVERMEEQALKFGASIKRETVIGLSDLGEVKMVSTRSGNLYQAKALIIATGITRRQLNVEGEAEFKGRGVSYCAVCDGPFFQGKRVAVVWRWWVPGRTPSTMWRFSRRWLPRCTGCLGGMSIMQTPAKSSDWRRTIR